MKTMIVAILLASTVMNVSFANIEEDIENEAPAPSESFEMEYDLPSAINHLHRVVPGYLKRHTLRIKEHGNTLATLLQATEKKGFKIYKHNFSKAKAAIKAALAALTSDLRVGDSHDRRQLNNAFAAAGRRIRATLARNTLRVKTFKHKACPTKRAEEKANQRKRAAKEAVDRINRQKICNVATTWRSMGIRGSRPKLGTAMNNKWAQARAQWVKRTAQHNTAIKAHKQARRTHDKAMTSFKVALSLEAKNTHRSCLDTHKDYERLNRDVQRNVVMRKEVYLATLIVACYAEFTNNAKAKVCQERKRRSNTSRWNIKPKTMRACDSRTRTADLLGPKNWQPSYRNCSEHRRIQKEKADKAAEKRSKKEKADKAAERRSKNEKRNKAAERSNKERNNKATERNNKATERNNKAAERSRKANEKRSKKKKGIHYNGMFYRTLDGSDPNGTSNGCESSYRTIPSGCTPVTSNSVCAYMGRHYRWSTHVIVCKHRAYGTVGYNPGNVFRHDSYYLSHSGNRAKTNGCSLRVLLQCR